MTYRISSLEKPPGKGFGDVPLGFGLSFCVYDVVPTKHPVLIGVYEVETLVAAIAPLAGLVGQTCTLYSTRSSWASQK